MLLHSFFTSPIVFFVFAFEEVTTNRLKFPSKKNKSIEIQITVVFFFTYIVHSVASVLDPHICKICNIISKLKSMN